MIEKHVPGLRSPCLCGSGKRFKVCCKDLYLKTPFNGYELCQKGDYHSALRVTRAHITWYRLCHQAHTVPFLKSNKIAANDLLKTDILALSELLDLLCFCYRKCGIINDFLTTLDFFSNAIQGDQWRQEFDYHKAIVLYIYRKNIKSVLKILDAYKWQDISSVNLLTLYLDVKSESTNAVEKITISQKIASVSDCPEVRLQYLSLVGVQYCLLNDFRQGVPILNNAISEYLTIPLKNRTTSGRQYLANAYMSNGVFTSNENNIKEAIKIFTKETSNNDYSNQGLAKTWMSIADCYLYLGDMCKAKDAYSKSLSYEKSDLTDVFLARALVSLDDCDIARVTLDRVNTSEFSSGNHFDLALSRCSLAIKTGLKIDVETALGLLKSIKTNEPYFKDILHNLLIQIYEIRDNTKFKHGSELIHKLNKIFIIQPNFFGLGININAAIECFLPKKTLAAKK